MRRKLRLCRRIRTIMGYTTKFRLQNGQKTNKQWANINIRNYFANFYKVSHATIWKNSRQTNMLHGTKPLNISQLVSKAETWSEGLVLEGSESCSSFWRKIASHPSEMLSLCHQEAFSNRHQKYLYHIVWKLTAPKPIKWRLCLVGSWINKLIDICNVLSWWNLESPWKQIHASGHFSKGLSRLG